MTRNELEQVLADHGYRRSVHGTHSDIWQTKDKIYELLSHKVFDGCIAVSYEMISVQGDKLVIHKEIDL